MFRLLSYDLTHHKGGFLRLEFENKVVVDVSLDIPFEERKEVIRYIQLDISRRCSEAEEILSRDEDSE